MIYMLDTNVCIRHLRNPASDVGLKLLDKWRETIVISAVTEFELYAGAKGSQHPEVEWERVKEFVSRFECVAFARHEAQLAAEIRSQLEESGQTIGPFDLQIAATAMVRGAVLVTHNVKEFSRVPHLNWEDWQS